MMPSTSKSEIFEASRSLEAYFSQGNLQYRASTDTWRFAENQWDYVGSGNANISSTYDGWIDLFGWGTSGYHDSSDPDNVNYEPWSTSESEVNTDYNWYGYGPSTNMSDPNLTGTSASYDWGVPFYTMNDSGSEIMSQTSTGAIEPMEGVFVVATEANQTLTFSTTAPDRGASLALNISQGRGRIDRAIVRFDEGQALPKFQLRETSTKVYIPVEGKDYAVVRSENQGEMPVSFKAEHNGSYTISVEAENIDMQYLHPIDNMTGVDIDLLAQPSYSFEARTTDYESRFKLVFATGNSSDGDNIGFINGMGNLVVFGIEGEATLQVVDILGHVLISETFSGSYNRPLDVAPGVYMIRLVNGGNVKTQKVVVR